MRRLSELMAGLLPAGQLRQLGTRTVTGVFDDSRHVQPGSLFVAVAGTTVDGRKFVADAVARGASVIVGSGLGAQPPAIVINVVDVRQALATLALRWHGLAADGAGGLRLAAVTGTNGKSTTAFMVRGILQTAGIRCALFGTVYYDLCGRNVPAQNTTPGALELAGYLHEARQRGATAAVMEASSHALDQQRTDGLRFAAAAFTNLTGDHLDYHKTMENYAAAKARLFAGLNEQAVAVMNRDDPAYTRMIRDCRARVVTYGIDGPADLHATLLGSTSEGTVYQLRTEGRELKLENALVGKHNVYNALAAAGLARALDVSLDDVAAGLTAVRHVPGRLQRVPCGLPCDVFVDYAHSDDSLRNVLSVLRPLARKRLITVFGCGGDRDRTKRPRMARVAAEFSDLIFVTSDNPRTEDPLSIIAQVLTGFDADARRRVNEEPDRARAIAAALAAAEAGDIVLIAGKGHEDYQIIGTRRIHFDDVEAAIQAAAEIKRFWPGDT